MESSVSGHREVLINAGRRGLMLKMNPRDIIKIRHCKTATITC